MSPEEALQSMTANDYLISSDDFEELTQSAKDKMTFVDLRSPMDFGRGHLTDAINIPLADLLDDESISLFSNSENIVLYGSDVFEASGPAMLLTQIGLENIRVLNTGYDGYAKASNIPSTELARYDYALVFQKAVKQHEKEIKAGTRPVIKPRPQAPKKSIKPKPKPKKEVVEEEEGC